MGREINEKDIDQIFEKHDIDGDRAINIEELKMIMLDEESDYEDEEYHPQKKSIEDLYG